MQEPKTYTKPEYPGIRFYEHPFIVLDADWIGYYPNCNAISYNDLTIVPNRKIMCFASKPEYNDNILKLFDELDKNNEYRLVIGFPDMRGVGYIGSCFIP